MSHVVKVVSLVTLSPTLIFFTSGPTSVTIPENSCPNITGGFVLPYSPLNACKSVPQIPEYAILIFTKSLSAFGSSTSL